MARAAPGTNGASSGPLFPSDGHSWGRSATQSWGYTLLHTLLLPSPLLGLVHRAAALRSLPRDEKVSVGVPDVGGPPVMRAVRLVSALGEGRTRWLPT